MSDETTIDLDFSIVPDEVPTVPPGVYVLKILACTKEIDESSGNAKYRASLQVVDGPMKGRVLTETFFTDSDPNSSSSVRLKKFCLAALGTVKNGLTVNDLRDRVIRAEVGERKDRNDPSKVYPTIRKFL